MAPIVHFKRQVVLPTLLPDIDILDPSPLPSPTSSSTLLLSSATTASSEPTSTSERPARPTEPIVSSSSRRLSITSTLPSSTFSAINEASTISNAEVSSEIETAADPTQTLQNEESVVTAPIVTPSPDTEFSTIFRTGTSTVDVPLRSGVANVSGAANNGNGFLENKVLSGVVFGICGLVGLVLLIFLITFATRKARRNRKLEKEIISWDPDQGHNFHANRDTSDTHSIEELEAKRRSPDGLDGPYLVTLPGINNGQTNLDRAPSTARLNRTHSTGRQPNTPPLPSYGQQQSYSGQVYPAHANW